MRCSTCGLDTTALRCPRCLAPLFSGCSGACMSCKSCLVTEATGSSHRWISLVAILAKAFRTISPPMGRRPGAQDPRSAGRPESGRTERGHV
jgi:hypothetical protein